MKSQKNKRELRAFEKRSSVYELPREYLSNGWTERKMFKTLLMRRLRSAK
jgi:hypothetical protein